MSKPRAWHKDCYIYLHMRTNRVKIVLAMLIMSISGTAAAEFGPGVWQQMQERGNTIIRTQITGLEISDQLVVVEFSGGRTKLCSYDPAITLNDQRIATLRDAYKSGELVELGFQGPWNTCLKTISQRRTNSKG